MGFEHLQGDEIPNLGPKRWVNKSDFGMDVYFRRIGSLKKMKCRDPKLFRSIIPHSIWDLGGGFDVEGASLFDEKSIKKWENFELSKIDPG